MVIFVSLSIPVHDDIYNNELNNENNLQCKSIDIICKYSLDQNPCIFLSAIILNHLIYYLISLHLVLQSLLINQYAIYD